MNATAPSRLKSLLSIVISLIIVSFSAFVVYRLYFIGQQVDVLTTNYGALTTDKDSLEEAYDTLLYGDHLLFLEKMSIEGAKQEVQLEYESFKADAEGERLAKIEEVYSAYQTVIQKLERNNDFSIDSSEVSNKLDQWGQQFLNQDFDALKAELATAQTTLDTLHQDYLASLPTPTPTSAPQPVTQPPVASAPAGYSYQQVATSRGTFNTYLVKMKLSEVTIKTITGNQNDCDDNCPAKSLQEYVQANGAYAGIHGNYFCPPDYIPLGYCSGSYSYDSPFYNSNLGKWLNEKALKWNNLGVMTFNGKSLAYAGPNTGYGGGSLTAGVSNFPMLVQKGNIVVNNYNLTAAQNNRGYRGAIGVDDSNVYLAISTGASVVDMAHVMKTLGATNALNLDGGGSSALYIGGSYKVGPGRLLPNAIVLVKS